MGRLGSVLFLVLTLLAVEAGAARERQREMRRGRPGRQGNERSARIPQLNTGEATYGGSGCPEGTMRVVFAPDHLSFSVLYDQFVAEIKEGGDRRRGALACETFVPIEIPNNMQMEITRVDYRGFAGLPAGAQGVLNSTFNFRGRGGDLERMGLRYTFVGPTMDNYEISSDALTTSDGSPNTEVSPCGGLVHLRIHNSLRVLSSVKGVQAAVTLDSIDGAAHATYFVNWRECSGRPRR